MIDGCPPWSGVSPDKHLQTATCQFFSHPQLSGCPVSQRIHQRAPNTNVEVLLFLFHPTLSTSSTLGGAMPRDLSLNIGTAYKDIGGCPFIRLYELQNIHMKAGAKGSQQSCTMHATPRKFCIDTKMCTQNIRLLGRSAPMTSHVCDNVGKHWDNNNWNNHGDRLVDCGVLY